MPVQAGCRPPRAAPRGASSSRRTSSLLRDRSWPYHERFDRYVRELDAGKHHEAAWAESFGDVPIRRLQEDLWIYRRELRVDTLEAGPFRAPAPPPPTVRFLSDGDVHLLWLLVRGRDLLKGRHDLDVARRQAPGSPEVALWSGRFAETRNDVADFFALAGHPGEGLPLARRAVALQPRSFAYLDTLALLLFESGEIEEAQATQERAMAYIPDGAKQPEMAEHLERFKQAVAERRGAAPRAGEGATTSAPK